MAVYEFTGTLGIKLDDIIAVSATTKEEAIHKLIGMMAEKKFNTTMKTEELITRKTASVYTVHVHQTFCNDVEVSTADHPEIKCHDDAVEYVSKHIDEYVGQFCFDEGTEYGDDREYECNGWDVEYQVVKCDGEEGDPDDTGRTEKPE